MDYAEGDGGSVGGAGTRIKLSDILLVLRATGSCCFIFTIVAATTGLVKPSMSPSVYPLFRLKDSDESIAEVNYP